MKICIWKQGLHILYAVGSKVHLPSAAVDVAWTHTQNQYTRHHIPESTEITFAAQGNAWSSQECSLQWMVFTKALSCKAVNENDNFRKAILVLDDYYTDDNIKTMQIYHY